MEKSELPIFIICMSIYFFICLAIFFKPTGAINLYNKFLRLFGFNLNYLDKAIGVVKILAIILLIFGVFCAFIAVRDLL